MEAALPPAPGSPRLAAPSPGRLRLADGRQLGWAEFGAGNGTPLLYCHGTPGCRLEAGLAATAAARLGLRLIAADRPGFGLSTPAPGRELNDVARDLEELCDHLGLERLLLLGVSGGAPFACASAYRLGPRVTALGLVAPVGPLVELSSSLPLPPMWRALQAWSRRQAPPLNRLLAPLGFFIRHFPRFFLRCQARLLCASDRDVLTRPAVRRVLQDSLRCALQPGREGLVDDIASFARPWGFSLARIDTPARIWHGGCDQLVPPYFGEILGQRLGSCTTTLLPDEGHFSLPVTFAGTILEALIAASPYTGKGAAGNGILSKRDR